MHARAHTHTCARMLDRPLPPFPRLLGVRVMYQRHPTERTGSCAALITGHERSLVTNLGAALKFTHKFLAKEENWKIVEMAEVIYIGGFVFDVSIQ